MKSDEEMIESILKKAHEKEKSMNRTKKTIAFCLVAVTVLSAAVGAGILWPKTPSVLVPDDSENNVSVDAQPTQTNTASGFRLLVAGAAEAEEEEIVTPVEHISGVKLPVTGRLVIENAAGLTDEEKNHAHARLNDRIAAEWANADSHHIYGAESESYIGTLAVQGKFIVFAEDIDALERIELGCGDYGKLFIMPAMMNGKLPILSPEWRAAFRQSSSITITPEEYVNIYENSSVDEATGETEPIGIYVNYDMGEAFLNEKELDPDLGYEAFHDEITFRAVYKDGSETAYTLMLTFDADGILSVNVK